MNKLDLDYQNLLQDILDNGVKKETRNGGTISVFGRQIRHDMKIGFPLLTTKKMAWKTMVTELLWFLRGDTDIRFLWENNCSIWDGDWEKNYKTTCSEPYTIEEVKQKVKDGNHSFHDSMFDMGPIYGKQWRSWETYEFSVDNDFGNNEFGGGWNVKQMDQIANLINDLKTNPDSRRLMVSAWNVGELDSMTLPPCHYGFQVYTRELSVNERILIAETNTEIIPGFDSHFDTDEDVHKVLDTWDTPRRAISLMYNARSQDVPLGTPFNLASYGLLLEIIAKEVNMVPDELITNMGDCHIYLNQIDGVKEQIGRELTIEERGSLYRKQQNLSDDVGLIGTDRDAHRVFDDYGIPKRTREPYELPTLVMVTNPELKFDEYVYDNFKLVNYQSHPTIKMPLSN